MTHASILDQWKEAIKRLPPSVDYNEVKKSFHSCYKNWPAETQAPPPATFPSQEDLENSNIAQFIKKNNIKNYPELLALSQNDLEKFLSLFFQEKNFSFFKKPSKFLHPSEGAAPPLWLKDALFNIFDSCFLVDPKKNALTFQAERGEIQHWTYEDLYLKSTHIGSALKNSGFKKGDAIAMDMVFTAECVAIYLGILSIGGVVVSIADSFAPEEIETRLKISKAKAIFTQDYIFRGGKKIPLYEKVCQAHAPMAIVLPCILGSTPSSEPEIPLRSQDRSWNSFLQEGQPSPWKTFESEKMFSHERMNILFSSGTTGEPKAIPWSHTTAFKCAMDGYFHHNIQPNHRCAWPTNIGWMMGPWLIFATLMNQAEMALFYGAPHTLEFCKFIEKTKVTLLGVIPSILKSWRNSKILDACNWTSLKVLSSTGECSSPEDMLYLIHKSGFKPIIEYCGGTEIGGGYLTGTVIHPCSPSTFSTPALGSRFIILDENEKETKNGELFLIPPSLGLSLELLNKNHEEVYFQDSPVWNQKKLRKHGDQVEHIGNLSLESDPTLFKILGPSTPYFRMHGRVDDTMNLGGIKTSSAEIERVLHSIETIHETAAIAVPPKDGGPSLLIIFCVLKDKKNGNPSPDQLLTLMQEKIKKELNPLFKIEKIILLEKLPRTASNKIIRKELRAQYSLLK